MNDFKRFEILCPLNDWDVNATVSVCCDVMPTVQKAKLAHLVLPSKLPLQDAIGLSEKWQNTYGNRISYMAALS
jgi:hypothetical protein